MKNTVTFNKFEFGDKIVKLIMAINNVKDKSMQTQLNKLVVDVILNINIFSDHTKNKITVEKKYLEVLNDFWKFLENNKTGS